MAPGSGTVARMSEEMYVERPACINYFVRSPIHMQCNAMHDYIEVLLQERTCNVILSITGKSSVV
jgi:hypothetical protein